MLKTPFDVLPKVFIKETPPIFKIKSLSFIYKENTFSLIVPNLLNSSSILNLVTEINSILEEFKIINYKGYINTKDKSNNLFPLIITFLKSLGIEVNSFAHKVERYNLWYNFLLINLYFISLHLIKKLEELYQNDPLLEDSLTDLKTLSLKLFNLLTPSIRSKLQKRGLSLVQNIYTGFDTEFVSKNPKKFLNKLLSTQIALCTKTYIKIPKLSKYLLSYVHPLTNEVISLSNYILPSTEIEDLELNPYEIESGQKIIKKQIKLDSNGNYLVINSGIELFILENSISTCISSIRSFKYSAHDKTIEDLTNYFSNKGLKRFYDEKKDQIIFSLSTTPILTNFSLAVDGIENSFQNLVKQSNSLAQEHIQKTFNTFLDTLVKNTNLKIKNKSKIFFERGRQKRTTLLIDPILGKCETLSLTRIINNYFCAHLTSADLPMFSDFESIKEELNIVQKSFITLHKPLVLDNTNVYIRDTMLLAPGGKKSLESIGELYQDPNIEKVKISQEDKQHMDKFLARDKKSFELYAIQDALIVLKHCLAMEEFNFNLKHIGIPLTLSSLGRKYVLDFWEENSIFSNSSRYQVSNKLLLGDSENINTPKGLFEIGDIGLNISKFIANYKGGRNESFMYGVDENTTWYDYDLVSAYTTSMACMYLPSYKEAVNLTLKELEKFSFEDIITSYLAIKTTFSFPKIVKFPSIACYLDNTTTVFPLNGKAILTGSEYYLAKLQGCEFKIESIYHIPPVKSCKPFFELIKELQAQRNAHPKGHIMNVLFKEIGNSIYGNVVRGMSDKRNFDIKSGLTIKLGPTELSNPILASWTTAFIRSVIGECLHNIQKLGGKIVSVTTDGFITNIKDLELKLSKLKPSLTPLFNKYQEIRKVLSENSTSLELKNSGIGIISWTRRGQLGIGSAIKAATGFQSKGFTHEELVNSFKNILATKEKYFEFTQFSLRGANEIYKHGGHVTPIYKDKIFRLFFDNGRLIEEEDSQNQGFDLSVKLLDSRPLNTVEEGINSRYLSKMQWTNLYNKNTTTKKGSVYKNHLDIAVRNFIKGYFSNTPLFSLKGTEFKNHKELLQFIQNFPDSSSLKISVNSISKLKNRNLFLRPVPKSLEVLEFVKYITSILPHFNPTDFY